MKDKLYQCPYDKAVKCNLKDCCLYCETFGEYLNEQDTEYVVFKTGLVWSDRLNSEDECREHIKESINVYGGKYTYRKMTKKEMDKYK